MHTLLRPHVAFSSQFTLTMAGMESLRRPLEQGVDRDNNSSSSNSVHSDSTPAPSAVAPHTARAPRRPTSYHNNFQTSCTPFNDDPPSYALASRQRMVPLQAAEESTGLPGYTCTVACEGKLQLSLESINPLGPLAEHDWREVYVVLRGTLLRVHRAKDRGPGVLLRSYTLQHAEVGLAVDTTRSVLVPQTRLAYLIPSSARKKAWQKDPDLFKAVKYTILRLRVETDQILLADGSEDCIFNWIHQFSSAIDISPSLDERSLPRQCTVPRRRRRRARQPASDDLADPALVAEQERIMREMYPTFAERLTEGQSEPMQTPTAITAVPTTDDLGAETAQPPSVEEEELDLNMMREDFTSSTEPTDAAPSSNPRSRARPPMSRHTSASSVASMNADGMIYATNSANFNPAGKWAPPHPRTATQVQRYVRRCMPVLAADAIRASDVLISDGKRLKINWQTDALEEWELKPPGYRSHHFDPAPQSSLLGRSPSQSFRAESATSSTTSPRALATAEPDHIEAADSAVPSASLALGRIRSSSSSTDKETGALVPASDAAKASQDDAQSKGGFVNLSRGDLQSMVCWF
nr:hypothetical protein CFP56_09128 [Quercus suber]